jgi:pilus assembly protein CpaB
VITLLVSPEDAQKLTLASQEGKIQLALRNPLDDDQMKVGATRIGDLYKVAHEHVAVASAPKPATDTRRAVAKPAAPAVHDQYVVEVYRGATRDVAKFDQKDAQ